MGPTRLSQSEPVIPPDLNQQNANFQRSVSRSKISASNEGPLAITAMLRGVSLSSVPSLLHEINSDLTKLNLRQRFFAEMSQFGDRRILIKPTRRGCADQVLVSEPKDWENFCRSWVPIQIARLIDDKLLEQGLGEHLVACEQGGRVSVYLFRDGDEAKSVRDRELFATDLEEGDYKPKEWVIDNLETWKTVVDEQVIPNYKASSEYLAHHVGLANQEIKRLFIQDRLVAVPLDGKLTFAMVASEEKGQVLLGARDLVEAISRLELGGKGLSICAVDELENWEAKLQKEVLPAMGPLAIEKARELNAKIKSDGYQDRVVAIPLEKGTIALSTELIFAKSGYLADCHVNTPDIESFLKTCVYPKVSDQEIVNDLKIRIKQLELENVVRICSDEGARLEIYRKDEVLEAFPLESVTQGLKTLKTTVLPGLKQLAQARCDRLNKQLQSDGYASRLQAKVKRNGYISMVMPKINIAFRPIHFAVPELQLKELYSTVDEYMARRMKGGARN